MVAACKTLGGYTTSLKIHSYIPVRGLVAACLKVGSQVCTVTAAGPAGYSS